MNISTQPLFFNTTDRGMIWDAVPELDGTESNRILFPVPPAALSMVSSAQTLGITLQDLADAPVPVQVHVMRAWFKANYQPGTIDDAVQFGADEWRRVAAQLQHVFYDPRVERPFAGTEQLVQSLEDEALVWVGLPQDSLDTLKQRAAEALTEVSRAIGPADRSKPGIGHNSQGRMFPNAESTLDEVQQTTQAIIAQVRAELEATTPDRSAISLHARWFISLAKWAAGVVAADCLQSGPEGASIHLLNLAHKAGEAAGALQAILHGIQ